MNATISLDGLLSFIRSLSLSPDNKEWLAERLVEDARHEQADAPCQYTTEQLEQRLEQSMQSYREGHYCTSDELRKRHAPCELRPRKTWKPSINIGYR